MHFSANYCADCIRRKWETRLQLMSSTVPVNSGEKYSFVENLALRHWNFSWKSNESLENTSFENIANHRDTSEREEKHSSSTGNTHILWRSSTRRIKTFNERCSQNSPVREAFLLSWPSCQDQVHIQIFLLTFIWPENVRDWISKPTHGDPDDEEDDKRERERKNFIPLIDEERLSRKYVNNFCSPLDSV